MTDIPRRPVDQDGKQMTALDMCLCLHIENTCKNGLFDAPENVKFLKWKLNNWNEDNSNFSNITKQLIKEVLVERCLVEP